VAKLKKPPQNSKVRLVRDEKTTPIERIFKEVVGRKMSQAEMLALRWKRTSK
jgi:hypothetical protein